MPNFTSFLNELDVLRLRRARELSATKARFGGSDMPDPYGVISKAVVVLAYAHWEGFYNDCVRTYLKLLRIRGFRVQDIEWMMLVGIIGTELQRLQDRNHSAEAKCDFVEALRTQLVCTFDRFDSKVVEARSNLDFDRLRQNYRILKFDITPFQRTRLRIDKELVGWRHGVAHGSSPDLSSIDISDHITFTNTLLLDMSDQFQHAMLSRSW